MFSKKKKKKELQVRQFSRRQLSGVVRLSGCQAVLSVLSVVLSGCPASRASFRFHQNEQRWFCQRQLIRTLCSQSIHKYKYKKSKTNTHKYKYKLRNTNTESSSISVCVFFPAATDPYSVEALWNSEKAQQQPFRRDWLPL